MFVIRTGDEWPQYIPTGVEVLDGGAPVGLAQQINFFGPGLGTVTVNGGNPEQIDVQILGGGSTSILVCDEFFVNHQAMSRNLIYALMSGSDGTGNGTIGNPFRTVNRALENVPLQVLGTGFPATGPRWVIITDVTDSENVTIPPFSNPDLFVSTIPGTEVPQFYQEGYVTILAIPTVLFTSAAIAQAVDPNNGLLAITIAPSPGWAVDQWKGKLLFGANAADNGTIANNSADTLYVEALFGATVTGPIQILDYGAHLGVVSVFNVNATVEFLGCNIDLVQAEVARALSFDLCSVGPITLRRCPYVAFATTNSHSSTCNIFECPEVFFSGLWDNPHPGGFDSHVFFNSIMIRTNSLWTSPTNDKFTFRQVQFGPIVVSGGPPYANHGTRIAQSNFGDVATSSYTNITDEAVLVEEALCLADLATLQGSTGNTGLGLHTKNGGKIRSVNPPIPGTTVSGAGGDMQSGYNPVRSYVDFTGSDPVDNEYDKDGDGSRIYVTTTTARPLSFLGDYTTAQRNAIPVAELVAGVEIYNTTTSKPNFWSGAAWLLADGTPA